MVIGDTTVPNMVDGAPLAGSEAVNRTMGLVPYSSTQANPDGLHGVARFNKGVHSSLFVPTFPDVTAEMQGQMASFIASGGTFVQVSNSDVLVPVINIEDMAINPPTTSLGAAGGKRSRGAPVVGPTRPTAIPFRSREGMNND
jgi:hypothetical protein